MKYEPGSILNCIQLEVLESIKIYFYFNETNQIKMKMAEKNQNFIRVNLKVLFR